ncbi:MAG TPA: hypothetical protein DEP36_01000 [Gammaproteobacteria bacterium]|nr:hypothetical protein [Gammaproteobacteria bacterium]
MQIRAVGMVWYRQEDYFKIKNIMVDSRKLPNTYVKWLKQANQGFQQLTAQGHLVEKVYLDPNTFPAWCSERGLDVDANARMTFANEFVARKYRNQS